MPKNRKTKSRFSKSVTRSGKCFSDLQPFPIASVPDPNSTSSNQTLTDVLAKTSHSTPLTGIGFSIVTPVSPVTPLLAGTHDDERWNDDKIQAIFETDSNLDPSGNIVDKTEIEIRKIGELNEIIDEADEVEKDGDPMVVMVGNEERMLTNASVELVPAILSKSSTTITRRPDVCYNASTKPAQNSYQDASASPSAVQKHGNANPNKASEPVSKPVTPAVANLVESNVVPDLSKQKSVHDGVEPKTVIWTSLFENNPRHSGTYTPQQFVHTVTNGTSELPVEIIDAGVAFWSDCLVGFFLDAPPPYSVVKEKCGKIWQLRGSLQVRIDRSMFFMKFSLPEERLRVLSAEPIIISGKPFIITPWTPTVDKAREQVLSIPVWTYFSHIPSVLQSLPGLNWLSNSIGTLKCFDANTVARDKLIYAKALIEITPEKPLPDTVKVKIADDYIAEIRVRYGWTPDICSTCHSFGHQNSTCSWKPTEKNPVPAPFADRTPLPPPPSVKWVAKSKQPLVTVTLQSDAAPCESDTLLVDVQSSVQVESTALEEDKSVVSDSTSEEDDGIYWQSDDTSWLHSSSGMRYDPRENMYYIYVTDLEDENRRLFYKVVGEEFVLMEDGEIGAWNKALFHDSTWDWKRDFRSPNPCYVPNLAVLFLEYVNVIGTSSSSGNSYDEE